MSVEQKTKSGPTQWSTHDPACNHCRTRKIKCGREHPQCANCKRDGAQCNFSDQGKRINHIKLLVDNFGGLEGRLVSIEKELVRLTDSVQQGKDKQLNYTYSQPPDCGFPRSKAPEGEWTRSQEPTDFLEEQLFPDQGKKQKRKRRSLQQQPSNVYVVGDQYHEPLTLLALCNELRDLNLKTQRASSSPTSAAALATLSPQAYYHDFGDDMMRNEIAQGLLTTLCSAVSIEEPPDLNHDSNTNFTILLPPKQLLIMACTPFFREEDPAIDLFCQSTFWANVDRIYSKPFTSADDAWALCFNNIILLVLGAGQPGFGSDAVMESQFAMPFISTMRCALAYPKFLVSPVLINVQALALLSVTAQQHLQPKFAEAILARACRLAKKMGLHQRRFSGARTASAEDEERLKVFRCLFLRDKAFSISRGRNCWLPSLDCSISFALGKSPPIDTVMFARLQLARLQEEIHRALYSSESFPLSTNQRRAAICRIEEGLRQWAEAYEDPQSAEVVQAIDVQLDFRASRIVALRSSSDTRHMEQVVRDARASSLLLSTAVGKVQDVAPPTPAALPVSLTLGSPSSLRQSEHASLRIRSLVESFSVPAFFALVKNIIWPVLENPDQCDVELLQTVSQIYQDLDHGAQPNTYTRKVSNTFQSLLAVVHVLRSDLVENEEQPEDRDQQQRYFHLAHQTPLPTPMVPISPNNFPSSASAMTWLPFSFSGAGSPSQSAPDTTTTNLSAFEFSDPLEYEGSNYQYDQIQQVPLSPHGYYNNKHEYASPSTSDKDYHHQSVFSNLPDISPTVPFDSIQRDANNHPF